MTKRVLILFIGFFTTISLNAQAKKWTLQECVEFALKNNITIQQTELNNKSLLINKLDAKGSFLPSISASASHSWNIGLNQNITTGLLENQTSQFSSAGLNANVDIYNGLQNQNRLRKSNLAILGSQYQLSKIQNDVSLNVANAYLQILFNKENIKAQKNELENNQKQFKRTTELVEAGMIPKGDLLDSKATLASTQQKMIVAENALFISKLSLAQLLQLPDFKNFDVVDEINYDAKSSEVILQTPENIIEKAKQNRFELKIAQNNSALAQKDIEIAKGALMPRLSAFYQLSSRISYADRVSGFTLNSSNPTSIIGQVAGSGQDVIQPNFSPTFGGPTPFFRQLNDNKGNTFGLNLTIPILNGFAAKNGVARAKIAYDQTKIQEKQANLDLERNVYNAISDSKGAMNAFESAKISLDARKQAFDYAKERFAVGMMNSFDFNQSQTLLTAAESELLRTKYDYIFKVKVLEFYFGIPITKM